MTVMLGEKIEAWLNAQGKTAQPNDYQCEIFTADNIERITIWNADHLGPQPTDAQLAAVQPLPPVPTSVAIVSTSTPSISGTYAFDATTQAKVMAIALYIQVNGKFPDGLNPFPWPDASGTMHDFASTSQFLALASALADYATALNLGQTPAAPLTIA